LEPSFALNLERGYLEIGDARVSSASDLRAAAAQPFVEEQGATGIIAKKRGNRSIVPE
jgi:hypothetical protein